VPLSEGVPCLWALICGCVPCNRKASLLRALICCCVPPIDMHDACRMSWVARRCMSSTASCSSSSSVSLVYESAVTCAALFAVNRPTSSLYKAHAAPDRCAATTRSATSQTSPQQPPLLRVMILWLDWLAGRGQEPGDVVTGYSAHLARHSWTLPAGGHGWQGLPHPTRASSQLDTFAEMAAFIHHGVFVVLHVLSHAHCALRLGP
jgi:hypothetical protein